MEQDWILGLIGALLIGMGGRGIFARQWTDHGSQRDYWRIG